MNAVREGVSCIGWLGRSGRYVTVATKKLGVAFRALLAIASPDVNLPLYNPTIVATVLICAPVVLLAPISNTLERNTADADGRLILRGLNLFGPTRSHSLTLIRNELVHRPNENKMSYACRERASIEVELC